MDTIKKQCLFCDEEYEGVYDEHNICDNCIDKICTKISKKYSSDLIKAFSSFKKTSSWKDMPYVFGSMNFYINQPFFIPVILCGDSIQFHNSEEEREQIIENVIWTNY